VTGYMVYPDMKLKILPLLLMLPLQMWTSKGGSVSSKGGRVSSRGGSVSSRGGSESSRGGSENSRGGSVSGRGSNVSSRDGSVSSRGSSVSSTDGSVSSEGNLVKLLTEVASNIVRLHLAFLRRRHLSRYRLTAAVQSTIKSSCTMTGFACDSSVLLQAVTNY
jgi:hypothetical protein